MPNITLAANAAAMPISRRVAFGGIIAAGAMLAAPPIAKAASLDALSALIAAHAKAREAFMLSIDEIEQADPPDEASVEGMLGSSYALSHGKKQIANLIARHFHLNAAGVAEIKSICPAFAADALASLKRDRDAALARLDEAFAEADAAQARYSARSDAEVAALLAIAAHRCSNDDERSRKARYLWTFREEMAEPEFLEALLRSDLPEGED